MRYRLLGFTLILASCAQANSVVSPGPCLPGGQIVLVKPAPGSTAVPTSSLTVDIAVSASLGANNYTVVLAGTNGSVVSGVPPQLVGPVPAPTPTASPAIPLPFASPIYYMTAGFNLATGQTYTAEIAGSGCTAVPITGATFST